MIQLKKIEQSEVIVLKEFTSQYILNADAIVRKQEDDFYNALLKLDLSTTIFKRLRNKLEVAKKGKKISVPFSVSEAIILLDLCQINTFSKDEFQTFVCNKVTNQLHKQLINL